MGFLDARPDLTGKVFSDEDLRHAQKELGSYLSTHHPNWLQSPRGILAERWNSEDAYNACYFIELFRILGTLSQKLDRNSKVILFEKFEELLEATEETQFEATLSELQFGSFLAAHDLHIEYEPPIKKRSGETGKPDFRIHSSGVDIFVDVTRFRYRVLIQWEKTMKQWVDLLLERLGFAAAGKNVNIVLPLEARGLPLPDETAIFLASKIMSHESGDLSHPGPEGSIAHVVWRSVPVILDQSPGEKVIRATISANNLVITAIPEGFSAVVGASLPEVQATNLLLKAIRQRLDEKRQQFTTEAPFLVCLRTGHIQEFTQSILELAGQRLWPNQQYRRVSGLLVFFPRMTFEAEQGAGKPPYAYRNLNPNAVHPVPTSLRKVMGLAT